MTLNEIKFGNPTYRQFQLIESVDLFDDLFSELQSNPFKLNDSDKTKEEMNLLIDFQNDIQDKANEKILKRYLFYDYNLNQAIANSFQSEKINISEIAMSVSDILNPFHLKLKYFYNRPRPSQLATYYKLKLFPQCKSPVKTPSYPSEIVINASVILNVIANKDPTFFQRASQMIEDVKYSRQYLGLNYVSDTEFSLMIADKILKHPQFCKEFKI